MAVIVPETVKFPETVKLDTDMVPNELVLPVTYVTIAAVVANSLFDPDALAPN